MGHVDFPVFDADMHSYEDDIPGFTADEARLVMRDNARALATPAPA